MKELKINDSKQDIVSAIDKNKEKIFKFVKENRKSIVNVNGNEFIAYYKKGNRKDLYEEAIFLNLVLHKEDNYIITGAFSYKIIKHSDKLIVM